MQVICIHLTVPLKLNGIRKESNKNCRRIPSCNTNPRCMNHQFQLLQGDLTNCKFCLLQNQKDRKIPLSSRSRAHGECLKGEDVSAAAHRLQRLKVLHLKCRALHPPIHQFRLHPQVGSLAHWGQLQGWKRMPKSQLELPVPLQN